MPPEYETNGKWEIGLFEEVYGTLLGITYSED